MAVPVRLSMPSSINSPWSKKTLKEMPRKRGSFSSSARVFRMARAVSTVLADEALVMPRPAAGLPSTYQMVGEYSVR